MLGRKHPRPISDGVGVRCHRLKPVAEDPDRSSGRVVSSPTARRVVCVRVDVGGAQLDEAPELVGGQLPRCRLR